MSTYNNIISIAIISAMTMIGCDDNGQKHSRSEEQTERLSILYDSIGYANGKYLSTCDSLLSTTHDSLDFYEIFVAKGGHYTISNPADSMLYYANKTIDFVERYECKDERLNGIASKAYSLKATYFHQMRQNNDSSVTLFIKSYNYAMQSDFKQSAADIAANTGDAYIFRDDLPKGAE